MTMHKDRFTGNVKIDGTCRYIDIYERIPDPAGGPADRRPLLFLDWKAAEDLIYKITALLPQLKDKEAEHKRERLASMRRELHNAEKEIDRMRVEIAALLKETQE